MSINLWYKSFWISICINAITKWLKPQSSILENFSFSSDIPGDALWIQWSPGPLSFCIPVHVECMNQVLWPYFQRLLPTCHFIVPQMLIALPIVHSSKHQLLKAVYRTFLLQIGTVTQGEQWLDITVLKTLGHLQHMDFSLAILCLCSGLPLPISPNLKDTFPSLCLFFPT